MGGGVVSKLYCLLSQKEGVGGPSGLRSSLGWHAHQGLGHGHGGWDTITHPSVCSYTPNSTNSHSRHCVAHGGHPCQGDHGDGLSRHGRESHGVGYAAKACGHGAHPHLVEGGWCRLAHLEWVGMDCWSRAT